jgi:hypothetical protein
MGECEFARHDRWNNDVLEELRQNIDMASPHQDVDWRSVGYNEHH